MKMKMISSKVLLLLPLGAMGLSGCETSIEGTTKYFGPNSGIAIPLDAGRDQGVLEQGVGAVVYDPDGCQGWLIDDGIEGYSGRRFDPVSGLPICNRLYPPGTVLGNYTTKSEGIKDSVPGRLVGFGNSQQTYQVQSGGSTGGASTFGN
jgi:hypothetical protein